MPLTGKRRKTLNSQNSNSTGLTPADTLERVIGSAPAPLLPGEVEADYVDVARRIVAVAQPRDAIDEFLTRDAIDLTWEILRQRRLKAGLLRVASGAGVRSVAKRSAWGDRPMTSRSNG
jgi:hypothetical protein